eukprot:g49040.t1
MACPPLLSDIACSTLWYNVTDASGVLRLLGRGHLRAQGNYGLLAFLSESCNGRPNCTCLICALERWAPCAFKQPGPPTECRCISCRVFKRDMAGSAWAENNNRMNQVDRSLKTMREDAGGLAPDTLASISKLVASLAQQGKLKEAYSLFCRALRGRENKPGAVHPDTITSRDFESRPHGEGLSVLSFGTRRGYGCAAVGLNLGLWKRQTFYDQMCGRGSSRRNRALLAETATALFGRRSGVRLCALISDPLDSDCDCVLCRTYSERGPLNLRRLRALLHARGEQEQKKEELGPDEDDGARTLRTLARLRRTSGCTNLWQIQLQSARVIDDLSYYGADRTLQFLSSLQAIAARAGAADPVLAELENEFGPLVSYGKHQKTSRFYLLVPGERREQEYEALTSRGLTVMSVTTLDASAVADWSANPSAYLRRPVGREQRLVVQEMVNRVAQQSKGGEEAPPGLDFSFEPSFLVFKCFVGGSLAL